MLIALKRTGHSGILLGRGKIIGFHCLQGCKVNLARLASGIEPPERLLDHSRFATKDPNKILQPRETITHCLEQGLVQLSQKYADRSLHLVKVRIFTSRCSVVRVWRLG